MRKIALLLTLASTAAFADPSVSEFSTSATAIRSGPQAAGTAYLTCSQNTRYKAGNSSVAATSTSPFAKAGQMTPVAVTAGQYISLKTDFGPGRCYLNRLETDDLTVADDLTVGDDLTVTDDALVSDDLTVNGELVVMGDAGFKGNVDIDSAQITGLVRDQNLFFDGADAGFSSGKFKNLEVTGTCTGCGTAGALVYWGDAGTNDAQIYGNVSGADRGKNWYLDGVDAGFSKAYAKQGEFGSTPGGATNVILGTASSLGFMWMSIAPSAIDANNYVMAMNSGAAVTIFNNTGQGFSFRKAGVEFNAIDANGKMSVYAGVATKGYGVPAIQDQDDTSTSSNAATLSTITAPAVDTYYEVGGHLNVTAYTNGNIGMDVTYTDCDGNGRTQVLMGQVLAGTAATVVASATTLIVPNIPICADASSAVTIRSVITGTATARFVSTIKKIGP